MFTRLLIPLASITVIYLLLFGFVPVRTSTTMLEAAVRAHADRTGVLDVHTTLTGIGAGTAVIFEFAFPSEAIALSTVTINGAKTISAKPRIERNREGIAIHFPHYEITSTAETIDLTYQIVIGQRLTTVLAKSGPRYGFADDKYVVSQLDYILPSISLPRASAIHYTVDLHGDGYQPVEELGHVSGQTYPDGSYRAVIALGPFQHTKGKVAHLYAPAGSVVKTDLQNFADRIAATLGELFRTEGRLPSVMALPSVAEDSFFPMRSPNVIAMDLLPLTTERAVRLGGTFGAALLRDAANVKHFSKPDEAWLVEGLPRYYGYRTAADVGLLDQEQIADSLSRLASKHPRLSDWSFDEVSAGLIGESGALTLYKLQSLLTGHEAAVDAIVGRFFHSWSSVSFFESVSLTLGAREARQFWADYVQNTRPIALSAPLDLAKLPAHIPSDESSRFRMLITSNVDGYLELCGCKFDQAGGAARRISYMRAQREPGSLQFDLGDFLSAARQSSNTVENLEAAFQSGLMKSAGYDAIVVGAHEMSRLSALGVPTPAIVSGNAPGFSSQKFVTIGPHRIRVVGWIDSPVIERYRNLVWLGGGNYGIDRLRQLLKDLADDADGIILLGNIRPATIRTITKENPKLIAIFSAFGSDQQPGYVNDTYVMFVVGSKYAILTLTGSLHGSTMEISGMEMRRLDDSIPDDIDTKRRLDAFYNSAAFVEAATNGMPSTAEVAHLHGAVRDDSFVGSQSCFACHPAQQKQWKNTDHSSAFATMYRTHRNHHPGCVQCHVTGFGEPGGYSMAAHSASLENVGCEACHGPGHDHVAHPRFDNIIRSPLRHVCQTCHTTEHSNFDEKPEEYMKKVSH